MIWCSMLLNSRSRTTTACRTHNHLRHVNTHVVPAEVQSCDHLHHQQDGSCLSRTMLTGGGRKWGGKFAKRYPGVVARQEREGLFRFQEHGQQVQHKFTDMRQAFECRMLVKLLAKQILSVSYDPQLLQHAWNQGLCKRCGDKTCVSSNDVLDIARKLFQQALHMICYMHIVIHGVSV